MMAKTINITAIEWAQALAEAWEKGRRAGSGTMEQNPYLPVRSNPDIGPRCGECRLGLGVHEPRDPQCEVSVGDCIHGVRLAEALATEWCSHFAPPAQCRVPACRSTKGRGTPPVTWDGLPMKWCDSCAAWARPDKSCPKSRRGADD